MTLNTPRGTIRGMIHIPEGDGPFPAVLFLHGFQGDRYGRHFLFVKFARMLAKAGMIALRFDFIGSGESDGRFEDLLLSGEQEDAGRMLDYLSDRRECDPERIVLLGHSMGGSVAGYTAGVTGDLVKGLLLWAPAGEVRDRFAERTEAQQQDGEVVFPLDLGGQRLGRQFFDDIQTIDVMNVTSRYQGPVCVIHGTEDQTVSIRVGEEYCNLLPQTELHRLSSADHNFNAFLWRRELYRNSLDFIQKVLCRTPE